MHMNQYMVYNIIEASEIAFRRHYHDNLATKVCSCGGDGPKEQSSIDDFIAMPFEVASGLDTATDCGAVRFFVGQFSPDSFPRPPPRSLTRINTIKNTR